MSNIVFAYLGAILLLLLIVGGCVAASYADDLDIAIDRWLLARKVARELAAHRARMRPPEACCAAYCCDGVSHV